MQPVLLENVHQVITLLHVHSVMVLCFCLLILVFLQHFVLVLVNQKFIKFKNLKYIFLIAILSADNSNNGNICNATCPANKGYFKKNYKIL